MKANLLLIGMLWAMPLYAGVVIDAGHGGKDSGAVYGNVYEKTLTLSIANKVARELGDVVMTRNGDYYIPLSGRCDIANQSGADVFVSIHINSSATPPKKGGAEVWFYKGSEAGKELASIVARKIGASRGVKAGKFYVLRHTRMPAILIECGFINVDEDRKVLLSERGQDLLAHQIAEAIKQWRAK